MRVNNMGPQVPFCDNLHAMKYRQEGETFRDSMNRIAMAMAERGSSRHYHAFREILLSMRFSPAGRIQVSMGASRDTTPFNCFVSGTIPDSFTTPDNEQQSSIMGRAIEAAQTLRMGGGIGYDFSTLRPRGAPIKKLQSTSSGPVSFMRIFDAVGDNTASTGHRRGAQMGVMRVDHPDILEFINAKHNQSSLTRFNMSIAVTDRFMEAVDKDDIFDLEFEDEIYRTVYARELWETIMRSTWDWAEPGVLFIDTINRMNNLWYCEQIAATNPCAEQTLPPFGACLLGSFNLSRYLTPKMGVEIGTRAWDFDWDQLREDIPHVVRAMDNVVDRAKYPLPMQEVEAKSKRRMGLGVMGLANAAETMGMPYGSKEFLDFERRVLGVISNESYRASSRLALEKGSFRLFDAERYCAGEHIQTLDGDVQELIRRDGIRNSHLTSIAPTGTIAMTADNVSSGIEPVFSVVTQRPVNTPTGPVIAELHDYAEATYGTQPRLAESVTAEEHVDVLCCAARMVDSAVSKTCNVTGKMPWDDFKNIYMRVWEGGGKGCTTFNSDGKKMALLTARTDEREAACTIDTETGLRSCE